MYGQNKGWLGRMQKGFKCTGRLQTAISSNFKKWQNCANKLLKFRNDAG